MKTMVTRLHIRAGRVGYFKGDHSFAIDLGAVIPRA